MPYKSQAQAGLFHSPNSPVSPAKVKEFDAATKGKHLPKRVGDKPAALAKGGRLVDHGDHFKVHTHSGVVHTIAKRGLSPHTVKHLQRFAEGGEAEADDAEDESTPTGKLMSDIRNDHSGPDDTTPEEIEENRRTERDAVDEGLRGEGTPGTGQTEQNDAEEATDYYINNVMKPDMPGQEVKVGDPTPSDASVISKADTSTKLGTDPEAPQQTAADQVQLQKHVAAKVHDMSDEEKRQAALGNEARTENANRQEELAKQTEAVNNEKVQKLTELQASADAQYKEIHQRQAQLRQDIENGKIDPNHFWADKSSGARISAGIGILLAGIGSGLNGGPNVALQMLDKAIDRDIDAQKANLNTKKSLLADTYRETGDLRLATAEAKNTLTSVALAKLNTIAAQSSSATVKANAKIANAAVLMKQEQDMRGIADRRSLYQANARNADVTQSNALAMQQAKAKDAQAGKVPREMQGAKISNLEAIKKDVSDHEDRIARGFHGPIGSLLTKIPGISYTDAGAEAITSDANAHALAEKVATALGGGTGTAVRIEKVEPLIARPSDSDTLRAKKREALNALIDTQLEAYRKQQAGVGFRVAPPTEFAPAAPTRKK